MRCQWIIKGPRSKGGRGLRVWTRQCKRQAAPGEKACWQHLPGSGYCLTED